MDVPFRVVSCGILILTIFSFAQLLVTFICSDESGVGTLPVRRTIAAPIILLPTTPAAKAKCKEMLLSSWYPEKTIFWAWRKCFRRWLG